MTKSEFLKLAESQWEELSNLQEEESFYEYEKQFDELWVEFGRKTLERSISNPVKDRRKKKRFESRYGLIEIAKNHIWSEPLNGFQISPYLQELQVYGGQMDNYSASVGYIEKYLRVKVNSSQMERVTKCYGSQIGAEMESVNEVQLKASEELSSDLQTTGNAYCMVDGSMILSREGEKANDWKEVKLGRLFTDADHHSIDKHHNWLKKSIYLAHLGDCKTFQDKFEPMIDPLDVLNERLVFVADGASWIWNWVEECYGNATQILDFYHAMEHLSDFSKIYFTCKESQKQWLDSKKTSLVNDQISEVIKEIQSLPCSSKKKKEKRKALVTYLQNNEERMLYKTFIDRGLFIGSGAIESAHRTVIQKRLKQSGQRWTIDGAQKVIDLRVVNASQQWDRVVNIIKENEKITFKSAA